MKQAEKIRFVFLAALAVQASVPLNAEDQKGPSSKMEEYPLADCVLHAAPPVEVGRAKGHHWFPSLHPIGEQGVLCEVVTTDDKAQGKWPAVLYLSRDRGASWRRAADIDSYGPISIPLGANQTLLMPYELWPLTPGDKRNAQADGTILTGGPNGNLSLATTPVKYLDFPRDLADYNVEELCLLTNGNILPSRDGSLLTTVYGQFAGESKYSNLAVRSDDGGRTWRFLSVVADWRQVPDAREGPDESNTVRLADGRLLCVYRVGSGTDYHKSYSSDEGATWTPPERMEGVFSVEPQLVRLDNGLILLSGGRPGLYLWVCSDGEGKRWERFNLASHHNACRPEEALRYPDAFCAGQDSSLSTSYTGMMKVGPNEVLLSYDRLANGWHGAPGPWGQADMVFTVRVQVERCFPPIAPCPRLSPLG